MGSYLYPPDTQTQFDAASHAYSGQQASQSFEGASAPPSLASAEPSAQILPFRPVWRAPSAAAAPLNGNTAVAAGNWNQAYEANAANLTLQPVAHALPLGWAWLVRGLGAVANLAVGAWDWLWAPELAPTSQPPVSGLQKVQAEFIAAMWDLQSQRAHQVREQVEGTRSLRELWHLRADVFKVISLHRGQQEAQLRIDQLDSHFPLRASRNAHIARPFRTSCW